MSVAEGLWLEKQLPRKASKPQKLLSCCQGMFYLQESQKCSEVQAGCPSLRSQRKLFIFSFLLFLFTKDEY